MRDCIELGVKGKGCICVPTRMYMYTCTHTFIAFSVCQSLSRGGGRVFSLLPRFGGMKGRVIICDQQEIFSIDIF